MAVLTPPPGAPSDPGAATSDRTHEPRWLPALDGLRGAAVLAVLAFHGGWSWAAGGYLGVSVFFTLSGFLLARAVLTPARLAGTTVTAFWRRRARRLGGTLAATVVGVAIAAAVGLLPARSGLLGDVLASAGQFANWRFAVVGEDYARLFEAPSPLLHVWSLSVEVQLYVLVPLLLLALGLDRRRLLVGVGLVTAALAAWAVAAPLTSTRAYYGTDVRAVEVLAGVLLGIALLGRRPGPRMVRLLSPAAIAAGAALLWCTATLGIGELRVDHGHLVAVSILSTVVVAAGATGAGPVASALGWKPLRWLGVRSYALYLVHWPVFLALTPSGTGLGPVPLFAVRVGVSVALAALVFRMVEEPVRRGLPARRAGLLAVGATLMAVVAVSAAPAPVPTAPITAAAAGLPSLDDVSDADPAGRTAPIRVVFLGDSQLFAVADAVRGRWSDRIQVVSAIQSGCGIGRGGEVRYHTVTRSIFDDCPLWTPGFPDRLRRFRADLVVVGTGPWDFADRRLPGDDTWRRPGDPVYDRYLSGELAAAGDLVSGAGVPVVWLTAPPVEVGRRDVVAPPFPADGPERPERLNDLVRAAAGDHGDAVADYAGFLATCPGGPLDPDVRPDGVHLTEWTADVVADWLVGELATIADIEAGRSTPATCAPD